MKTTLILIIVVFFAFTANGQTQMTATVTKTVKSEKFRVVQYYLNEAKRQVAAIKANEAVNGSVKYKTETAKLFTDLQAILDAAKTKFQETTQSTVTVDSLGTIQRKQTIAAEITRLGSTGEDSTVISPKIRALTVEKADLTKIMAVWGKVIIVK